MRTGPSASACDQARLGLYVHVPFCAAPCPYCHFSKGALSAAAVERYLSGIERECALRAPGAADATFTSVFFGGGTPSALSSRHFTRMWHTLRRHFAIAPDAEITLEANPETVKPSLLDAWAAAGVNRLSMGVQSFDAGELKSLGRIHGPDRPAEAFALARAHGFRRLSLDLMFGFPGHGPRTWEATLERALALGLEHLSAYCYIPEEGTPMGDASLGGALALPDEDAQADLYAALVERASSAGLEWYETSNAALPGGEARHNLVYWLRRDALGLGPSAHGLWRGVRYANAHTTEAWAQALDRDDDPAVEREAETFASRSEEIVLLGLRLAAGLRDTDHAAPTWRELLARYGEAFERGVREGRLERTAHGWRVPPAQRFVADDTIAWVAVRAHATGSRSAFDTAANPSLDCVPCPAPLSPAA